MTFAVIQQEKAVYPVRTLCRVLGVAPSGYYAWAHRPVSPRAQADLQLRRQLRVAFAASRRAYGSPRLLEVLRTRGHRLGRNRVIRLMRAEGLRAKAARRFRVLTCADPHAAPAPNRLGQRFQVTQPNRVWAGDITALTTHQGWLYLAVLLDLYSRRVVGWATSARLDAPLVCAAWRQAVCRRPLAPGLLHHSDRGSQYTSATYQRLLQIAGARVSMSRPGNCYDNAPVESFFRTLKVEIADRPVWSTRAVATAAVADYIERFYNAERLHSTLGYQTPIAFEATAQLAATV